jgi:Domain of unknown function (DUF4082)/PEP-CTERM motif
MEDERMKRAVLAVVFLCLVGAIAAVPAAADPTINPVVQYTSTSTLDDTRPFTLGYEFTTTSTFDINALGVWDSGSGQDQQVGIWDSEGDLLVSTTVSSAAPDIDNFQWASVSYSLVPGTYTIGATFDNTGATVNFPDDATGITTLADYSWVTDEYSSDLGLNDPTISTGGSYGNNGILWADLSVGSSADTPEPSSLLLLGTGIVGLAGLIRRKYSKAL